MAKNVLGLDLGIASIGWSLVSFNDLGKPAQILGMGSRIIPLPSGKKIGLKGSVSETYARGGNMGTVSRQRTNMRTARKMLDRFQRRRDKLGRLLRELEMSFDDSLTNLAPLELWGLRARAAQANEILSLPELGRVLYHLIQKRGYKHGKAEGSNTQETEYVTAINTRHAQLQDQGLTVGQYIYRQLLESALGAGSKACTTYRAKGNVYPREAYLEEFNRIMAIQRQAYPEVLTESVITKLRDCIFYQRPLKSCKHLVSYCEFERRQEERSIKRINKEGQEVFVKRLIDVGPRVIAKSSPLAEVCRLWENINNIRLYYEDKTERVISLEEKQFLFEYLLTHDNLTLAKAKIILQCKRKDLKANEPLSTKAGIAGHRTLAKLRKAFEDYPHYEDRFRFQLQIQEDYQVDLFSGEVFPHVTTSYTEEPLYKLWHILYSIPEREAIGKALEKQLGISRTDLDSGLLDALMKIDFTKEGYANKSAKFICKLIPHLQQGYMYSEAAERAGYKHSKSLTKEELATRQLVDKLDLLPKNSLRQPLVEKVLNQMINLVNALKEQHGEIDEVRVELARELRKNKNARAEISKRNKQSEEANKAIGEILQNEYHVYPSLARKQKYKLWLETQKTCIYCGNNVSMENFLEGLDAQVEHIIPKALYYDDSMANKTCACTSCNQEKGKQTGYDYAVRKGWREAYISRVNQYFSADKYQKKKTYLLMTEEELPSSFTNQDLSLTQYIARRAVTELEKAVRYVYTSSGSVTSTLRHLWGYDTITRDLYIDRYRAMGETELDERGHERIKEWGKRKDHRHHAVDALIIACTPQASVTNVNDEVRFNQAYLVGLRPFPRETVMQATAQILSSRRSGAKAFSYSINRTKHGSQQAVRTGFLTPRGALSQETVYGQATIKGQPEYVCKFPLSSLKPSDTKYIIDPKLRKLIEERLQEHGGKPEQAFATPLYLDKAHKQEVRSVRCLTGYKDSSMVPLKKDQDGKVIGFALSGNNHHIAIYKDEKGKFKELPVSLFQAIERARYGLPVMVRDPRKVMEQALEQSCSDSVLDALPQASWSFVEALQTDDMFLLKLSDEEIAEALQQGNYQKLGDHLYRVQKLSSKNYWFRYHLETQLEDINKGDIPTHYQVNSPQKLQELNARKVKINLLGQLSLLT